MLELPARAPAVLALAVTACAWLLAPRGVPLRSLGVLGLLPLGLLPAPRPGIGEAWVDVLDVGNGLAVVVRTRQHALVFDAGPGWGGDSDSGERFVVPYLRGEGVRELDVLVVSHSDDDHAGGAISVAASRMPGQMLSSLPREDATHGLVARSAPCVAGQRWMWDGVGFEMLHPGAARASVGATRKENDWSCVLRVATPGGAVLLAGDAEARSEREMLARGREALRADVLVVPHHGSRTSSTPAFLDAVAPRQAIFPVGYRNRFRHPNAQVLERYRERGIAVWRSDEDGAIRVALAATPGTPPAVMRLVPAVRYWSDRRPRP
jgi:competence protein ComEC